MLSGVVRCDHCGNLFSPYLAKGKYSFLQPPVNRPCIHYNISEKVIIDELEQIFANLHFNPKDKQVLLNLLVQQKSTEINTRDKNLSELHAQSKQVSQKKSRLMDLFLEQGITRAEFDVKNKELDSELSDINYKISEFDNRIDRYYENLPKIIELADSCGFLLKSSRNSEKRQIIKLITSNCLIDGKNPVITIRNPFKILSRKGQSLTWLGQLDSNQRHTD